MDNYFVVYFVVSIKMLYICFMKTTNKLQKAAQRKEAISQGAYDGRFKSKIIPNKKAVLNKKAARVKVT